MSTKGGCEFLCEFCVKNILVTCLNVVQHPPKVGVSVFILWISSLQGCVCSVMNRVHFQAFFREKIGNAEAAVWECMKCEIRMLSTDMLC